MEREIKFRVFCKELKKVFDVDSIDFENGFVFVCYKNGFYKSFPFDDVELMQFTGLCDMQGNELFEGDIVRVYFDNGTTICHFVKDYFSVFTFGLYCVDFDILGNAYENPDLLKEIN